MRKWDCRRSSLAISNLTVDLYIKKNYPCTTQALGLATALGLGRWQAGSPGSWLTFAVPILIVQLLLLNNINAMRIVSEHTSWCTIGAIGSLLQPPRAWSSELTKNHPSWQCCQNKFRFRRRNPPAESGSNHDKVPCKKMCPRSKHIRKELNQTHNFNRNTAPSHTLFLFFGVLSCWLNLITLQNNQIRFRLAAARALK